MGDVKVEYILIKKVQRQKQGVKPRKIELKSIVENLLRRLGIEADITQYTIKTGRDKIVITGRLRFKHYKNTKYYNTYLYLEQGANGEINGNIAATYITYNSKKGFITGKIHYLLFTTTNHIYLLSMNITTNIIYTNHPLYTPLYIEIFGKHPLYNIPKPRKPLKTPTLDELICLIKKC